MKKFFTTIVAVLMACCCLLFSGCDEKETYYFHSLKTGTDKTSYTFNIGDKMDGIILQKESYILCLDANNKCILIQNIEIKSETSETKKTYAYIHEGVWRKLDEKIYIQIDGKDEIGDYDYSNLAFVGTKDGDMLTLTQENVTLTLKK